MQTRDQYHEQCDQRNKEILLDLATESPNDITKDIILSYDVDKDESDIYKAMDRKYKANLSETAEYLKIDTSQMLKDDIIKSILSKLNSSLLELCVKCSVYYAVDIDAEQVAKCACGQHCHYSCYKDIAEVFKNYPGVVFKCSHCYDTPSNTKPRKTSISSEEPEPILKVDEPPPVDYDSNNSKQTYKVKVVETFNLDFLQNRFPQPSYDICEQYKRFDCPHGKNGLTEVNGDICQKLHPKKCFRWMRHGKDAVRGCNKGGDCSYYHPVLCRNSVRYNKCLKSDCTYTHLQGTRRYDRPKPTTYDDPISHQHQNRKPPPKENSVPTPWTSDKESEIKSHQDKRDLNGESVRFLGDLIQSIRLDMKAMHQELTEVKKTQQLIPQYMPVPQYMYNLPNPTQQVQSNPNAQYMYNVPNPTQQVQTNPNAQMVQLTTNQPFLSQPPTSLC